MWPVFTDMVYKGKMIRGEGCEAVAFAFRPPGKQTVPGTQKMDFVVLCSLIEEAAATETARLPFQIDCRPRRYIEGQALYIENPGSSSSSPVCLPFGRGLLPWHPGTPEVLFVVGRVS